MSSAFVSAQFEQTGVFFFPGQILAAFFFFYPSRDSAMQICFDDILPRNALRLSAALRYMCNLHQTSTLATPAAVHPALLRTEPFNYRKRLRRTGLQGDALAVLSTTDSPRPAAESAWRSAGAAQTAHTVALSSAKSRLETSEHRC